MLTKIKIWIEAYLSWRTPLGAKRSSDWFSFRKQWIGKECEICGSKKGLNLHHIEPFHLKPELELEPMNVRTLCRTCHLIFGHLWSWRSFNNQLSDDIKIWNTKKNTRP